MDNSIKIQKKIDESADFYSKYLKIDSRLLLFCFKELKRYFKGSLALEIGPANGEMSKLLKDEFDKLHIVEGSEILLEKIPNYANVKKYNCLIEKYNTEFKYDTIIMSHVLEHIADPLLALNKVHSILKSDGVFLVSVPNAKSLHRLVAVEMGLLKSEYELNERDHELGHYRIYDLGLLKSQIVEAGFKIVTTGGYFLKPLTNNQIEQYWTNDMIEGFYKVGKHFQESCAEIYVVCSK